MMKDLYPLIDRLQALLDCETGKRAPEGWESVPVLEYGRREWRKDGYRVFRHQGSVHLIDPDGKTHADSSWECQLQAIESITKE